MSGPSYQVWLRDIASDALHLDLTDYLIQLEWTRVASDVGAFSCILPESFPKTYLDLDSHLDWRVEIWRRADEASPLKLENIGLIRRVTTQTDEDGITNHVISGPDLMHLLTRRIVYSEDCRLTSPSGYAQDHMRWIVRAGYASTVTTSINGVSRAIPTTNGWTFSIEADTGTGDQMRDTDGHALSYWRYQRRVVMDNLKDIYAWSIDPLETYAHLYFTIDFDDYKTWVFRVHPDRIGIDHSGDSGQPIIIGLDYGNMTIPVMDYDRNEEWTSSSGFWGEGDYAGRYTVTDVARAGHSVINLIERAVTGQDWDDSNAAMHKLHRQGTKHRKFSGKIVNGPGCLYGRDWGFGDEVVMSYMGQQYESDVIGVKARLDNLGNEDLSAVLDIP